MKLAEKISVDARWQELEQIAIQAVTAGGMAAMGFYRDAWHTQTALDPGVKNPSTNADLQATVTILNSCHSLLAPLAGEMMCGLSYLGEETGHNDYLWRQVADDVLRQIHSPQRFFENHENVIRVIFDGIDGTGNFSCGIPIFCSALAILVDDQLRVSAIYDPLHHEVFSAVLPGPVTNPEQDATAHAWIVASGSRKKLTPQPTRPLQQEAVGIHLTRSHPDKLTAFLSTDNRPSGHSILHRLAEESSGIYALNCGIVAMKEVAVGSLGAFVNIITNPWDVAAGEVLVRATGGKVTQFDGLPVSYDTPGKISLIAAKAHLHEQIRQLIHCNRSQGINNE